MQNLVGTINHVYLYSLEPYDLEMFGHPPSQLINVTALCNRTDFHLLIHLAISFHTYNCKQLIPTEAGEK